MKEKLPRRVFSPTPDEPEELGSRFPLPNHVFAIRYSDAVIDTMDYRQMVRRFRVSRPLSLMHHCIRTPLCYANEVKNQAGFLVPVNAVEHVYLANEDALVYENFCRPWSKTRRTPDSHFVIEEIPTPDWYGRWVKPPAPDEQVVPVHSRRGDWVALWLVPPHHREKYRFVESLLDDAPAPSPDADLWKLEAERYFKSQVDRILKDDRLRTEEGADIVQRAFIRVLRAENAFRKAIREQFFPQYQIGAFYKRLLEHLNWTIKTQRKRERTNPIAQTINLGVFESVSTSPGSDSDAMTLDDYLHQAMSVDTKNSVKRQMDRIMGKDALRAIESHFRKVKDGALLFKVLEMDVYRCKTNREIAAVTKLSESQVRTALKKAVEYGRKIARAIHLHQGAQPLQSIQQAPTATAVDAKAVLANPKKKKAKRSQRARRQ